MKNCDVTDNDNLLFVAFFLLLLTISFFNICKLNWVQIDRSVCDRSFVFLLQFYRWVKMNSIS